MNDWTFPNKSIGEYVAEADKTIELLERVDRVPPGCRIRNYRQAVADYAAGRVDPASREAQVVYRALAELSSLSVIARALAVGSPSQEVRRLLRSVISGQDLPDDETKTGPRDNQHHLYIAAVLRNSGMEVQFAEPDLLVRVDGRHVGIAAKRITSAKQIDRRISDGQRQLRRAKKRGIVWIEFGDAIQKFSGVFTFDTTDVMRQHENAMVDHAYGVASAVPAKAGNSTHLVGVLLSWTTPRTIRGSGSFEAAEFVVPIDLHEPGTIEHGLMRALHDGIEAGLRGFGQLVEPAANTR